MNVTFSVHGLPPKKREWSIWTHPNEVEKTKALRKAAFRKLRGVQPATSPVRIRIRIYADRDNADLDNTVAGICDGLQCLQRQHYAKWGDEQRTKWKDMPEEILPDRPLALDNDKWIDRIVAERLEPGLDGPCYDVELEW